MLPITPLPNTVGVGLKSQHYQQILDDLPELGWFEVHPENYMGDGGLPHKYLTDITQRYPLSMHGVGMSLGSADGVSDTHLNALKKLVDRYRPAAVSEHLAWSHNQGVFLNDLLPLPYNPESLEVVCYNIHKVQDALGRTILIENPSAYLGFENDTMGEAEFLAKIVETTGCGLLLDINNVYVSATNQNYDAIKYIQDYPLAAVGEIHLAGHTRQDIEGGILLIDDHGSKVIDEVWSLFDDTLKLLQRPVPILIEWDTNIPPFAELFDEAQKAQRILDKNKRQLEIAQ